MADKRQVGGKNKIVVQKGSMTVFFCLSLLLVGAMICTCLESARTAGLRFMAKTASDSALQSVFAEYHEQLWEDYHVFFHYEEEDLTGTLKTNLSYYEAPTKELYGLEDTADLWDLNVDQISVGKKRNALSDGGRLFLEQAITYEKYQIAETLIEELLGRTELLGEIDKVRAFAVTLSEGFETVQQISTLYQDVRDGIGSALQLGRQIQHMAAQESPDPEAVYEAVKDLAVGVGNLKQSAQQYMSDAGELGRQADALAEEYGDSEGTIYGEQVSQLRAFTVNGLLGAAVDRVNKRTDEVSGILASVLTEMETLLNAEKDTAADESTATDGNGETAADGNENAATGENENTTATTEKDTTTDMADVTEKVITALNTGIRIMEELDADLNSAEENDKGEQGTGDGDNGGTESGALNDQEQAGNFLLETVKQWKNTAVLSLVMGADGVQMPVDYFTVPEKLPSKVATEALEGVTAMEKGLFIFYVTDTFTSVLSDRQTDFAYQQEYILFGKPDSRSNLSAMAERLLAVREGLNLAFLLTNARMRSMAETVAYALVGGTGIYPLVLLTQFVILAAWAFAESVVDVRGLFDGERVPVWKTEGTWRTSIGGTLSELGDQVPLAEGDAAGLKLSYSDYLRIFLLMKDTGTLCLRSMDIIQQEIGVRQIGFDMSKCLGEAEVSVCFSSPFRLISLPIVGENTMGCHRIEAVSSYVYK